MAQYPYDELGTAINREFVAGLNKNFDDVEKDVRTLREPVEALLQNGFDEAALESNFKDMLNTAVANLQPDFAEFKEVTETQINLKANDSEVRKKNRQIGLNDFDDEALRALSDAENVDFIIDGTPRVGSVGPAQTSFVEEMGDPASAQEINLAPLATRGNYYDPNSNGVLVNTASTQNFKATSKLTIKEGDTFLSDGVSTFLLYKADGTYTQTYFNFSSDEELSTTQTFTIPEGLSGYMIGNVPRPWWPDAESDYPNLFVRLRTVPKFVRIETLKLEDANYDKEIDPYYLPEDDFYNQQLSVDGKRINAVTGLEETASGYRYSKRNTVKADDVLMTLGVSNILRWDAAGNYLGSINYSSDTQLAAFQKTTIPSGTSQIAFNVRTFYYERAMVYFMTTAKKNDIPNTLIEAKLDATRTMKNDDGIYLGDSIIGGYPYPTDIPTVVSHLTGAKLFNAGFGGTRAAAHTSPEFDVFSLYKVVDALVSGDFSAQEAAAISIGKGIPDYFKTKVAALKLVDLSKKTIAYIDYGTNDQNGSVVLDTTSNAFDTAAYLGAIRYSVRKLQQNFPNLRIILVSPIFRMSEDGLKTSDNWTNGNGKTLADFVRALEALAKELHVEFIDTYNIGMNQYTMPYYFATVDFTHPNSRGRALKAKAVARGSM